MFLLESPHRGNSNEYTQHTVFNIKRKITLNYPTLLAVGFFQGTQERVRNSHGRRAIRVRATEALLYIIFKLHRKGFEYHSSSDNALMVIHCVILDGNLPFIDRF